MQTRTFQTYSNQTAKLLYFLRIVRLECHLTLFFLSSRPENLKDELILITNQSMIAWRSLIVLPSPVFINTLIQGVCKIYEEHLKRLNPSSPQITYDISQVKQSNINRDNYIHMLM